MNTAIVAAIIGAIATLAAALIAKWPFGLPKPGAITPPVNPPGAAAPVDAFEARLRNHPDVQRLLNHRNWGRVARAAIDYHLRGMQPIDPNWINTGTWVQVTGVVQRLRQQVTADV